MNLIHYSLNQSVIECVKKNKTNIQTHIKYKTCEAQVRKSEKRNGVTNDTTVSQSINRTELFTTASDHPDEGPQR